MKKKKINFLAIAWVLLFFVVLTIYPMPNLYARYIAKGDSSDSALVAKFNVSESFDVEQSFPIEIKPGESLTRKIIVNNNGDVAINVTVTVENITKNLPITFMCEEKSINPHEDGEIIITISWDEEHSSPELAEMVDIVKFSLTAVQID